jgi:hypothetical protein
VAKLFARATVSFDVEREDATRPGSEDDLEEVDFEDMGRLQAEVDAAAAAVTLSDPSKPTVVDVEERFTGFYIDEKPATIVATDSHAKATKIVTDEVSMDVLTETTTMAEMSMKPPAEFFYVDTAPTPVPGLHPPFASASIDRTSSIASIPGIADADDEEIVYVAPHPRHGRSLASPATAMTEMTELPPISLFLASSALTTVAEGATGDQSNSSTPAFGSIAFSAIPPPVEKPAVPPAPAFGSVTFSTINAATPPRRLSERRVGHKPKSLLNPRVRRQARTGRTIFGGMGTAALEREESQLREERDPRMTQRRRGDSDLNWGHEDDEAPDVDMDADMDADISIDAMRSFVRSMGQDGSRHMTMEDVEIEEKIRLEDAEEEGSGSSDGVEDETDAVFDKEERHLVGEPLGEDDDEEEEEEDGDSDLDSDEDEDGVPQTFQVRLDRLRQQSAARAASKGKAKAEGEEDELNDVFVWEDGVGGEDDEYVKTVQVHLPCS